MALGCVACRLSLPVLLCMFMLFVSVFALNVDSSLVYDHHTLLNLRLSAEDLAKCNYGGHGSLSLLLARVQAHLCHAPALPQHKCLHCWGKRSGRLVRLKACLKPHQPVCLL